MVGLSFKRIPRSVVIKLSVHPVFLLDSMAQFRQFHRRAEWGRSRGLLRFAGVEDRELFVSLDATKAEFKDYRANRHSVLTSSLGFDHKLQWPNVRMAFTQAKVQTEVKQKADAVANVHGLHVTFLDAEWKSLMDRLKVKFRRLPSHCSKAVTLAHVVSFQRKKQQVSSRLARQFGLHFDSKLSIRRKRGTTWFCCLRQLKCCVRKYRSFSLYIFLSVRGDVWFVAVDPELFFFRSLFFLTASLLLSSSPLSLSVVCFVVSPPCLPLHHRVGACKSHHGGGGLGAKDFQIGEDLNYEFKTVFTLTSRKTQSAISAWRRK